MNQEYRERVKRHLEAGGDPKYVNVKRKAQARRESDSKSRALEAKKKKEPKNPWPAYDKKGNSLHYRHDD